MLSSAHLSALPPLKLLFWKRKRVYTYLKKLKPDIVYLQETHLTDSEHKKMKRDWVGQVFFHHLVKSREEQPFCYIKMSPLLLLKLYLTPQVDIS